MRAIGSAAPLHTNCATPAKLPSPGAGGMRGGRHGVLVLQRRHGHEAWCGLLIEEDALQRDGDRAPDVTAWQRGDQMPPQGRDVQHIARREGHVSYDRVGGLREGAQIDGLRLDGRLAIVGECTGEVGVQLVAVGWVDQEHLSK